MQVSTSTRRAALFWVVAGAAVVALGAIVSALASSWAETPSPVVRVWAVGDGADGRRPAKALAARMAQAPFDRLLYLGDVYENGTSTEYSTRYSPVYGSFARRTLPTPGNHEWPRHTQGHDRYWQRVTGRAQPPWYSVRLGGWEVLSLNSEAPHHAGSEQVAWVRHRLSAGGGTCRVAMWHRPRFSAGTRHGDQEDMAPLWEAVRGRVSIVLNAHEHNSQRFPPMEGTTQFVAGGGGHDLYARDPRDRRPVFIDDTTEAALRLELLPTEARFAFVARDGRRLDEGRVPCRP